MNIVLAPLFKIQVASGDWLQLLEVRIDKVEVLKASVATILYRWLAV